MDALLIANRGEIAVRIARTCRDLGIRAVAVHSDVDADALHVRVADAACRLPGESASETYLSIEGIVGAARQAGADAVHPGYGFLSESAAFAEAVAEAGLLWVGPPASAIAVMGDKVSARRAAAAAAVPVVPGTTEPLAGPADVVAFGTAHGWPVAIKAAAGGGGRGMRVVESADDAPKLVAAAAREAAAAFGDDRLYLERFLQSPRHLEVQLLADAHGTVVAVGDRDCSIQRRHQKLVEEAPAPGLPDAVRDRMAKAAVAAARAVGYRGAGTVEFLYEDERFYFLEMNTRLQVEHTVTEAVSGVDLVAEQLRIAMGARLGAADGSTYAPRGHAIELRINAEDPAGGRFIPAPGRLRELELPSGPGVRIDAGYTAGDTISDRYDNLIAKLVVWGPTRDVAIRRGVRALSELRIDGVPTTAEALATVLGHDDFAGVRHGTPWLEANAALLPAPGAPSTAPPDRAHVLVNGRRYWLPGAPLPVDGRPSALAVPAAGTAVERATPAPLPVPDRNGRRAGSPHAAGAVTAPMQGRVLVVQVSAGQVVERGAVVCVLEAMKMEQEIVAEIGGTVRDVPVRAGDGVAPGDVLAVIAP